MKFNYLIISLVSGVLFTACDKKEEVKKNASTYPVQTIVLADRTLTSDYSATVTGCQTVEIRPQVEGMLTGIFIHEGDVVHKGQVLFEIDPAQYQATYDIAQANVSSAEAAVATAQLVLDSNHELFEEKVISDFELNTARNELAEAEAKLSLTKAELDKAGINLSYTQVKSPVNGVASMIPYRVGALVGTNISTPLVTVSDDGEVYAYFSMAENQMLDLVRQYGSMTNALGEMPEVELRMSNGEIYGRKGRIDAVSGTITGGAIRFRATFPNPDRILRDGGTGTVVIPQLYTQCIVIPQGATYEIQDKKFVFKVVDGKAVSTEIAVLPQSNGREYVVTEGLAEGDVIISEGAGLIKEGTEINPKTDN